MKSLMLTFDLEKFTVPRYLNKEFDYDLFEISVSGIEPLLEILDKNNIHSTFFTTVDFAERYQGEIKKILSSGHELGLHGMSHKDYSVIESSLALSELARAKKKLESLFGVEIKGFRAPMLKAPNMDVLKKAGLTYDSSIAHSKRDYLNDGIIRFPISVTSFFKLPLSWIWFRNLGINYAKLCTRICLLGRDTVNIYFHPWDFVDLSHYDIPAIFKRNSGQTCAEMLDKYLKWTKKINLESTTISSFIRSIRESSQISDYFDRVSESYDNMIKKPIISRYKRKEIESIISMTGPVEGMSLLDVGAGSGIYSEKLKAAGADVFAVDLSEKMVNIMKNKGINARIGNAEKFDMKRRFHKIFCLGVLEFSNNPERIMKNLRNHLAEDGELIIIYPRKSMMGLLYRFYHIIHGFKIRLFSDEEIDYLVRKFGLIKIREKTPNSMSKLINCKLGDYLKI